MVQPYPKVQACELDVDLSDTVATQAFARLGALDTHLNFDPSLPGKHHGHLILAMDESGPGPQHLRLPVCVIRGKQSGQHVTMLSGIHGDEIEGPLTLQGMAQQLDADDIQGCLVLLPSINLAGLQAGTRCSPLDSRDLDRCFPGNPTGSISDRVAFEIFDRFIRPADLVVDLRSGGSAVRFALSAAVRFVGSKTDPVSGAADSRHSKALQNAQARQQNSEAAMIAFGAPNSVRFPFSAPGSCLQAATEAASVAYLQTELGGGGGTSAETLAVAQTGCYNLLRHTQLLQGEIELRATRMLEVRDNSFYIHATRTGTLQPHARLGQELHRGDPLMSMINLEDSGAIPHVIRVPRNGVLLALRDQGATDAGDLLAIIADEVQR